MIRGTKAALLAFGLLLAGCATEQTGALIAPRPPAAAPRLIGPSRPSEADHVQLVAAYGGEYRDPALKGRLNDIVARLVPKTERPGDSYDVTVLDSPVVNAFALPSGHLYVTRGLLALANDTSEIAAVFAHEIAHVTRHHAAERGEFEARSVLFSRVMVDVLKDPRAGEAVRSRSRVTLASFSRRQEFEADRIGVATIAAAGYDPFAAARFLTSLGRMADLDRREPERGKGDTPDMLSTHPATQERIARAEAEARKADPRADRGHQASDERTAYLDAVDGLAYGDDPKDGVIRGRRFAHPRLKVAFEAPDGFSLENTSRAVLGSTADGRMRLLFDAVETPDTTSLEQFLTSGWSDAIEPDSVHALSVDGQPAVTASSHGKEWAFRLGAVRIGPTTYRVILAARAGGDPLDRAFDSTLQSVHALGADEAARLRPQRVALVTAGDGETPESLAAHMATDQPLARFLVLNGLDAGAALKAGGRYKIVVD